MPTNDELGPRFSEWQALTDAYAQELDALQREEPGAACRLAQLADRLAQYAALFAPGAARRGRVGAAAQSMSRANQ